MQIAKTAQSSQISIDKVKSKEKSPTSGDKVIIGGSEKGSPDFLTLGKVGQLTAKKDDNPIKDFYNQYRTPVNIAGGALLGAGIAHFAGVPGGEVLSAAGTGAFAGFFAGDTKQTVCMAGGAVIGAAIATFANAPGIAVVSAAGTGTFVGWLVNQF